MFKSISILFFRFKITLLIAFLTYSSINLNAQLHNTYWYNGYGSHDIQFQTEDGSLKFVKKPFLPYDTFGIFNSFHGRHIFPSSITNRNGENTLHFQIDKLFNSNYELIVDLDSAGPWYTNIGYRSLFVPNPVNDSLYYLFLSGIERTSRTEEFAFKVLTINPYANLGKGAVIENKNLLNKGGFGTFQATSVENGFWLVYRNDSLSKLYSYFIGNNGISLVDSLNIVSQNYRSWFAPVRSRPPSLNVKSPGGGKLLANSEHCVRFSPQGSEFCFINRELYVNQSPWYYNEYITSQELSFYSFDPKTGQMQKAGYELPLDTWGLYNFDYSPNGKFLYVSVRRSLNISKGVYRFSMEEIKNNTNLEFNSVKRLDTFECHGVKLGPNGKLYYLNGFLGGPTKDSFPNNGTDPRFNEIINPDANILSELRINSMIIPNIGEGTENRRWISTWNYFPYTMYFPIKPNLKKKGSCALDTVAFELEQTILAKGSYLWDFGDGVQYQSEFPIASHLFLNAGFYDVKVYYQSPTGLDSISQEIEIKNKPKLNLPADTLLFQADQLVVNIPTELNTSYIWNQQDSTANKTLIDEGRYIVKAENNFCATIDSFYLHKVEVDISPTQFCEGDTLLTNFHSNADSIKRVNNGSLLTNPLIFTGSQILPLRIYKKGLSIDTSLVILKNDLPRFDLGPNKLLCSPRDIELRIETDIDSIRWMNGSREKVFIPNNEGLVIATAFKNNCSFSDSMNIKLVDCVKAFYEVGCLDSGLYFAFDSSFSGVRVTFEGRDTLIQSFQGRIFMNQPGEKDIFFTVSLDYLKVEHQISVSVIPCLCNVQFPTAFTPNLDGLNDQFQVTSNCVIEESALYVFNSWGEQLFESKNSKKGWDATYKGITVQPGPYLYLFHYSDPITNVAKKISGVVYVLK